MTGNSPGMILDSPHRFPDVPVKAMGERPYLFNRICSVVAALKAAATKGDACKCLSRYVLC